MLTIGIIGAGRIGRVHATSITNYIQNAKIKAISDIHITPELTAWAASVGITELHDDYHQILSDKEIDAVLICSSTNTHAQIAIEAAKAGKHIFCEKPIDTQIPLIKEVISAVKKHKVKFQVGFNRRFDHNFKALKDHVTNGKIGVPHIIKITSRDPDAPPIEYVKVSGGMFLDMTVHDFDMARYLSGSEVVEVYAAGAVLVDPAIGKAGDIDTAVITLKMQSGAIAVIDNSRKAIYGYDQRAEVFGSLGAVESGNDTDTTVRYSHAGSVESDKPKYFFLERYMQSFADEMKAFVDAVINNTDVPVGAEDGLPPIRIALAANLSLKENRPVKISEIVI